MTRLTVRRRARGEVRAQPAQQHRRHAPHRQPVDGVGRVAQRQPRMSRSTVAISASGRNAATGGSRIAATSAGWSHQHRPPRGDAITGVTAKFETGIQWAGRCPAPARPRPARPGRPPRSPRGARSRRDRHPRAPRGRPGTRPRPSGGRRGRRARSGRPAPRRRRRGRPGSGPPPGDRSPPPRPTAAADAASPVSANTGISAVGRVRQLGRQALEAPDDVLEAHRCGRAASVGGLVDELPPPSGRSGSSIGGRSNVERFRDPRPRPPARGRRSGVASVGGVRDDGARLAREHERPRHGVGVGDDPVARLERPREERPRERVLDQPLDRPLERPRAERRVRALAHDQRPGGGRQLEHEVVGRDPPLEVGELQVRRSRRARRRSGRGTR